MVTPVMEAPFMVQIIGVPDRWPALAQLTT